MSKFSLVAVVFLLAHPAFGSEADANKTRAQGAGAGCLLGGVLGVLVKSGEDDDADDRRDAAAIGCGAGGLAGLAFGNNVAKKKAAYASAEEDLEALIAADKERVASAKARLEESRAVLISLQTRRVEQLDLIEQQRTDRRGLRKFRGELKTEARRLKKEIGALERQIGKQQKQLALLEDMPKEDEAWELVRVASVHMEELEIEKRNLERALAQMSALDIKRTY